MLDMTMSNTTEAPAAIDRLSTAAPFTGSPVFMTTATTTLNTTINTADIHDANIRARNALIPVIFLLSVFMLMGIVGNSLVCYVFGFKLKKGAQNFFILCLAVFDLLSSTVGMPSEIVDMVLHLEYPSDGACKIMRFINTFTALGSISTLVVIAIDRFRRVHHPLKLQITKHVAKRLLIPVLGATVFFTWPAAVVYGLRTVDTDIPGVEGKDCTIADDMKDTVIPLVYNGVLFLGFIILTITLIVLYTMILRGLKQHEAYFRRPSVATTVSISQESTDDPQSPDQSSPGNNHPNDKYLSGRDRSVMADETSRVSALTGLPLTKQNGIIDLDEEQSAANKAGITITISQDGDSNNSKPLNAVTNFSSCSDNDLSQMSSSTRTESSLVFDTDTISMASYGKNGVESKRGTAVEDADLATDVKETLKSLPGESERKNCAVEIKEDELEIDIVDKEPTVIDPNLLDQSGSTSSNHHEHDVREGTNVNHVKFAMPSTDQRNFDNEGFAMELTADADQEGVVSNRRRRPSDTPFLTEVDGQENGLGCLNPAFKDDELHSSSKRETQCIRIPPEPPRKYSVSSINSQTQTITRKTTIIVFVVTAVFILSFVPHLCLQVAHLIKKGFDEKLEGASFALYNLFLRSYYINSVANPIIYGVMNSKFRDEVRLLAKKIMICKK